MKLKIEVKRTSDNVSLPKVIKKGDWVDLRSADTINLKAPQAGTLKKYKVNGIETSSRDVTFNYALIPLGIAMKLPKGFEAVVLPRSSTYKNFGIIQTNHMGVIDNSYCGDNDEWKYPVVAMRNTVIYVDDKICQFRIQLSQKATVWQKLKWLFCSGIKLVEVNKLNNSNRGGLGSTGIK